MDNKKTFADLFSSSTVNNEQEESILDENIKNQENDKKKNTSIKEVIKDKKKQVNNIKEH